MRRMLRMLGLQSRGEPTSQERKEVWGFVTTPQIPPELLDAIEKGDIETVSVLHPALRSEKF